MAVAGAGLHALKPLLRLEKSEMSFLPGEWGCGCVLGDSTQADGMVVAFGGGLPQREQCCPLQGILSIYGGVFACLNVWGIH